MKTVSIDLPETVFSALRKTPDEFVQEMRLAAAISTGDCLAIVDDRAARRCGVALGITTLGTGGVLLLAKRRGLILEVAPRIQT